jgi:Sulfotransferase family
MTASLEPSCAPRPSRGRVPDFFIVGHAKCGTTALYEMLRRHPQIYMPDVKEPWFFACESPQPAKSRGHRWTTLDQTGTRRQTLADYLSLFETAAPDQRVGEASTHYLWSHTAPGRIVDVQPAARIIAILREPASFLRSLHLQLLQNRHETVRSFRKAMALEQARRQGRRIPRHSTWPRALIYSDRVRYVEQLRRYRAVFPPEQMLVLIYDDFRRDNAATVRAVLRFLDADESSPIDSLEVNPTVSVRSEQLRDVVRAVRSERGPVARAVKASIKALAPSGVRRDLQRRLLYTTPRPPDEHFMIELRRRFKGEVVALSEYLGRDLVSLWGYDVLD